MLDLDTVTRIQRNADELHSGEVVDKTIADLADQIGNEICNTNPIICCVMNGGIVFCNGLMRHWDFPMELDYVHTSRYREDTTGSNLIWQSLPKLALQDRTIVIVDDIFDEGETLKTILQAFTAQGAKKVLSAVLIEKEHDRKQDDIRPDFIGLTVEDRYVFGAGMDYKGYFRNLSGIYAIGTADVGTADA